MKKISLALLAWLLLGGVAYAQTSAGCVQLPNLACADTADSISADWTYTGAFDAGGGTIEVDNGTVASLPAAGTVGRIAVVTDGNSDSDCTTGTGSTYNLCIDNGTTWVAAGDGAGGGGVWTDLGSVVHITTGTGDDLALGNTTLVNASKLSIDGDADQVQLTVQGFTTQTDSLVIAESSAGTEVFNVDVSGDVLAQSIQDIDGPGTSWSLTSAGLLTLAGDLVVTGGDITLGTTSIFSGGDTASLDNVDAINATTESTLEGAIDIAGDVTGTGLTAVTIANDAVDEIMLNAVDTASDEDILTFETTTGDFEWHTAAEVIGAGALQNVLTWNEKVCLTADCTGVDAPCDCCTGAGAGCAASTFTLAAAPRVNCTAGVDDGGGTITAVSNGITMRCLDVACGGVNEFTFSGNTFTPCNAANTPLYVTYEQ